MLYVMSSGVCVSLIPAHCITLRVRAALRIGVVCRDEKHKRRLSLASRLTCVFPADAEFNSLATRHSPLTTHHYSPRPAAFSTVSIVEHVLRSMRCDALYV